MSSAATASSCRRTVRRVLESGDGETVKPGDPRLARAEVRMIATPQRSLEAAATVAQRRRASTPAILGDAIEGEARDVGKVMAGIARHVAHARRAVRADLRADLGRRDDGHRARRRPRRAQRRVPALARDRARRRARHLRASPATPTASTARRKSPARSSRPTRWRARGSKASGRATASRTTTVTAFSARWAIRSSPARRSPTSTTSGRSSSRSIRRRDERRPGTLHAIRNRTPPPVRRARAIHRGRAARHAHVPERRSTSRPAST